MAIVIGQFRGTVRGVIDTDTPYYQFDDTSTADTTYFRYEDTTVVQFLERINATKHEACYDLWANRTTTSKWRPINNAG